MLLQEPSPLGNLAAISDKSILATSNKKPVCSFLAVALASAIVVVSTLVATFPQSRAV